MKRISEIAVEMGMSTDALRYYEKIGLMPKVSRNNAGVRLYSDKDMSRLRFIKRAQKMRFSLKEIGQLLSFRENPQQAKPQVRALAHHKLAEIKSHLEELGTLRDELQLLTGLCNDSVQGCPILEKLDDEK
jgi:DNA-binding transcriptional MerR regulator